MSRIQAIEPAAAEAPAKAMLEGIQKKFGALPNLFKVLAHSPAALQFYVGQIEALTKGVLDPQLREQLAVVTAGANHCDYCASAHTLMGKGAGLTERELAQNLHGRSLNPRTEAALKLARSILEHRGEVSEEDLKAAREAGYSEAELVEIMAHVGMNIFTNYFNRLAKTEVDFPLVSTSSVDSPQVK